MQYIWPVGRDCKGGHLTSNIVAPHMERACNDCQIEYLWQHFIQQLNCKPQASASICCPLRGLLLVLESPLTHKIVFNLKGSWARRGYMAFKMAFKKVGGKSGNYIYFTLLCQLIIITFLWEGFLSCEGPWGTTSLASNKLVLLNFHRYLTLKLHLSHLYPCWETAKFSIAKKLYSNVFRYLIKHSLWKLWP